VSLSVDPRIGSQLAGYRIDALVGRGGMGVVYRAHDLALDRDVALKLLAPELAQDIAFRERFLRESRLAAALEHPNVIPIHDAGEIDGQLYIAMRLVDGTDLKTVLCEGPLEPARAVHIVEQIAGALDAAHARGLVHRDVKPSNVLVTADDHAYLADFGLTRRLGEAGEALGAMNSLGTVDYVAPEQIRGDELDGRADQYSLACLLHETLTGQPPFHRTTDVATLYAHLEEEPQAPPGLEHVLDRALAKQAADRYPTCAELAADARRALGLERRPSRWPLAVAALGVAAITAALLAFFMTRGEGTGASIAAQLSGDGRAIRIDPATGKTLSAVAVGQDPSDIAVGSDAVWVASVGSGTLARIDSRSGRLAETISVSGAGSGPSGIAIADNRVWIVDGGDDKVRLYDVRSEQFSTAESSLPAHAGCVCPGEDLSAVADGPWFWIVSRPQDALERFTAEQGTVDATPLRAGSDPVGLALDGNVIWVVTTLAAPTLFKVDPATNRVIGRMDLPPTTSPSAVAAGEGAVWVTDLLDDTVLRIEGRLQSNSSLSQWETLRVSRRIPVGLAPTDIAVGDGFVWVANYLDGTISRIDPETNSVETFDVAAYPKHLAVGRGSVWVAVDPP
jgi:streptogramin lyase